MSKMRMIPGRINNGLDIAGEIISKLESSKKLEETI